jgi:hypothetical protein
LINHNEEIFNSKWRKNIKENLKIRFNKINEEDSNSSKIMLERKKRNKYKYFTRLLKNKDLKNNR